MTEKKELPFCKMVSLKEVLSSALIEVVGRACLSQMFSWARFSEREAYFTQGFARGVQSVLRTLLSEKEFLELYAMSAFSALMIHPLREPSEMESWVEKELVAMVSDATKVLEKASDFKKPSDKIPEELKDLKETIVKNLGELFDLPDDNHSK